MIKMEIEEAEETIKNLTRSNKLLKEQYEKKLSEEEKPS